MAVGLIETEKDATFFDESEGVRLSVPREDCLGMVQLRDLPALKDPGVYIRERLSGQDIRALAAQRNAKSASVIISDATRGVPTRLVAGPIIRELTRAGIPLESILFVVALGVHRDATQEEIRSFIGDEFFGKVRVENHTPYEPGNLCFLGRTSRGTPVEVNRRAYECDLHLSVGKVEPHCFAGFSGGRKAVLPGISSARTIAANHTARNISHENSIPGVLAGNLIHEDMVEAARLYRLDFTVNFVVNDRMEPAEIFMGGMAECHEAAVEYLQKYAALPFPGRPDLIVATTGNPKNIDFYQAVNTLAALTPLLEQGMVVALCCECREGVNSRDMLEPFEKSGSLTELEAYMLSHYKIQMDCTLMILRLLKRGVKIIVSSPNLTDREVELMRLTPCRDRTRLMQAAYQACGSAHPKVLFCPHPQKGLPMMGRRQSKQKNVGGTLCHG